LSLSPSRTGAQVLMLYTHAIARVTHDLAEMPDWLLMHALCTSVQAWSLQSS